MSGERFSAEELEAAEVLAFMLPKEDVRHEVKEEVLQKEEVRRICYCKKPLAANAKVVDCAGKRCARGTFHLKCLGLTSKPRTKKWYCEDCQLLG